MIRILLVDDQRSIREKLRSILQSEPDFQVVGTANDGYTAIEQVQALKPDLVMIDMEMPGLDGLSATKIICQKYIGVKVVILSIHDSDEYVSKSLHAGAMGYLLKNTPPTELKESIRFVHRGYAQLSPGLFDRLIASAEINQNLDTAVNSVESNGKKIQHFGDRSLQRENLDDRIFMQSNYPSAKPAQKWHLYALIWLASNAVVWTTSLLYLLLVKPTYVSSWSIAVANNNSSSNVNLPGIGEASSNTQSSFDPTVSDPRENYKFLAETDEFLEAAADRAKMSVNDFGDPKIKIVDNTTLMEFKIQGSNAQEAQAKAIALQQVFEQKLDEKRQDELQQQSKNLGSTLKNAEQKLQIARQRLSKYQTATGLNSNDQLRDFSINVEGLRRQQAENLSQLQKTKARFQQLLQNLNLTSQQAADAFTLQSDQKLQKYLDEYSQASAELVNLKAKYYSNYPEVIDKQAQVNESEAALYQQARLILGRSVDRGILQQLNLSNNSIDSKRAALFQELISLQGEQKGFEAQTQELNKQIAQLESKRNQMSQQGSELDNLEQNVQIAEAVFSSTLTKLDLSKSHVSASYPFITTVSKPNLPKKASSPQPSFALAGSVLSSLFLTTAILSLWHRDRKIKQTEEQTFAQLGMSHQATLPNNLNSVNSVSSKR